MKNKYKFKRSQSDKGQPESYYPFINSLSPVLFLEEGGNIYTPKMVIAPRPTVSQWTEMSMPQIQDTTPKKPTSKPSATQGQVSSRNSRGSQGSGTSTMYSPEMLEYIKGAGPGAYEVYISNPNFPEIPNLQSNRGNRIYGTQDWSEEQKMNDFKKRHRAFFEQEGNKNWDPKKQGDTRKFQEWYEAEAKRLGTPSYFTGNKNYNKVDDKFGQYTWSAPSFQKRSIPVGKSNRTYAATDETSNTSQLRGPIDMNYLDGLALTAAGIIGGGAMLAGVEALPALAPAGLGVAGRVLTREAVRQAPKIMTKEGLKQIPRTIPNTIPKGAPAPGGRFFPPKTPSSYGTRISFEMGGMPQQQQQVDPREILGMFLQTLSEEEQEQFIAELQQMQPEEQMQVVQAIYQKLQQEMQQLQMQQQMMSAQQGDIQMYKEGGTPRNGQTKRSTQKGKKMAVYMDGKWHHFGDSSMQDYRTHKSEKRRQAFYSRHKKNLQGDDPRSKAFRVYARKTWQEGGQTPNVMIEVEGGESVMLPNGELQRFEGPKHSEGGIPVTMPEGAKIYSEHLKAPKEVIELVLGKKTKKKYSYADLSKKFPTKPFEQKLQNPELDKYERQAALVKLENNRTMLETIFQAQETEKEMKNKKVQMSQNYSGMPMAQDGFWQRADEAQKRAASSLINATSAIPLVGPLGAAAVLGYNILDNKLEMNQNKPKNTSPPASSQPLPKAQPTDWNNVNLLEYGSQDRLMPEVLVEPSSTYTTGVVRPLIDRKVLPPEPPQKEKPKPKPKTTVAPKKEEKPKFVPRLVMSDGEPPSLEDAPAELGTQRAPLEPTYNPEEVIEAVDPGKEYLSQGPFIPAPLPPAKKKFGISRQLSGSIFDALMAASNRLNVDEPQYRDNRKYPMFTRFVDFEDKEVGKNYNLAMQQIMNSNMPEQAKQAQIANLNAKLQDYQGKQDLQRNQLYQQKLNQDTDKLQAYMDRNVDQATADLENYRMKKARVEDLKNQFRAKRKADIVNPIRQYLDFVQEVDLQNQIYSDNFRMNPFTGKVDFYQSSQDPLKQMEQQMAQYKNTPQFSTIPGGGGQFGTLYGVPVHLDPQGRLTIIETPEFSSGKSNRDKEARQAAMALQNYGTTRTTQGG